MHVTRNFGLITPIVLKEIDKIWLTQSRSPGVSLVTMGILLTVLITTSMFGVFLVPEVGPGYAWC